MEELQPTFVLFSPYKFCKSKWTGFMAKHGFLMLAVLSLICIMYSYQCCSTYLWLGYLPPLILCSIVYPFNIYYHENKTFIWIQICLSNIFYIFGTSFLVFVTYNIRNKKLTLLTSCVYFLLFPLMAALQIAHRKVYSKDLSTPEGVQSFNKRDAYNVFLCCYSTVVQSTISLVCSLLLSPFIPPVILYLYCFALIAIGLPLVWLGPLSASRNLNHVSHLNRLKKKVHITNEDIYYDIDGRPWFAYVYRTYEITFDGEESCPKSTVSPWDNICKLFNYKFARIEPEKSAQLPL